MAYGGRKVDRPFVIDARFWNGYTFVTARELLPAAEMPAALAALTERKRALIPTTPPTGVTTQCRSSRPSEEWFRTVDVESGSLADLVATWREAWAHAGRAWGLISS